MRFRTDASSILLGLVVTFLGLVVVHVLGQEAYTQEDLMAMTEDQLEQICIVRGFQILRDEVDPSTGLTYELSHNDFVEAARRCLDIEQEMNELLEEYPELAAEVEEEIKKLEAEQISRQLEIDALQKELEGAQTLREDGTKNHPSVAFVSSSDTSSNNSGIPEMRSDEDLEISDDVEPESVLTDVSTVVDYTEKYVEDVKEDDTELILTNETSSKDDFTMTALTFEIIREITKQVENDLKRIMELMTPVIRPIILAGDVVWRHLKVAFESARRRYGESKGSHENDVNKPKQQTE